MHIFNVLAKILILSTVFFIFSCERRSHDLQCRIDFLPCEKETTEEYGCLDNGGCFVSCSSYSSNEREVSPVINGYCFIDGTLYKVESSISDTTPIRRNLACCGIMHDGLIPVCEENGPITIVNKDAKDVFGLKSFNEKEVLGCYSFSDSKLRVVLEDSTFIYVNKNGQQMFGKIYSWATDFKNGRAIVQTTSQNRDLYSLIDDMGIPVFTFESSDKKDVVVSYDMELLSAKENERIVIYDFKGKRLLECPVEVSRVYSFCKDGFIYFDENDKMGLMAYSGEKMIRSRYEQLVSHGRYFLALTKNDEIRLLDKKENIKKEFDGEEIISFRHVGFDFPDIINSIDDDCTDDEYYIIDDNGNIITEGINIDFFQNDIAEMSGIRSNYFPSDEVLSTIIELCGEGYGKNENYGTFFNKVGTHCYPKDITFLSSLLTDSLEGHYSARKNIGKGINYDINFDVVFDEPIIRSGMTSLSTSAWLIRTEIRVWMPRICSNEAFYNKCIRTLLDKGCVEYCSKNDDYILNTIDKKHLFVIFSNWNSREFEFCIYIMQDTQSNRESWKNYINNTRWRN